MVKSLKMKCVYGTKFKDANWHFLKIWEWAKKPSYLWLFAFSSEGTLQELGFCLDSYCFVLFGENTSLHSQNFGPWTYFIIKLFGITYLVFELSIFNQFHPQMGN